MYDEFGKPDDGEKCYNYEEADEDVLAEGKRIADGDITIDDCIAWLLSQAENVVQPGTPTANKVKKTVDYLQSLREKNEENQMWMQEVTERNKFWNDFMEYITENAVGDKLALIQTVHDNEHNWSEGYVKVQKRINEKQELLLDFTTSKGDKRTATWQPSDNYACWQTCGMVGDDYSGFLLMPTHKDDEYFCIYYQC
jgi:hypothetical protein